MGHHDVLEQHFAHSDQLFVWVVIIPDFEKQFLLGTGDVLDFEAIDPEGVQVVVDGLRSTAISVVLSPFSSDLKGAEGVTHCDDVKISQVPRLHEKLHRLAVSHLTMSHVKDRSHLAHVEQGIVVHVGVEMMLIVASKDSSRLWLGLCLELHRLDLGSLGEFVMDG